MQGSRALIAVAALVVVVALFFVLRDNGGDETTTMAGGNTSAQTTTGAETTTGAGDEDGGGGPGQGGGAGGGGAGDGGGGGGEVATIVVEGGEPVGGVQELSFTEGEAIRFAVESDVSDEVHLHGYDVAMEVAAGGTVEFDVPATAAGVFEVELEHRVVPIAEITVNPA